MSFSPELAAAFLPPPAIQQWLFYCQYFESQELEAAFQTHFAFEQAPKDVIWSIATSIMVAIGFFRFFGHSNPKAAMCHLATILVTNALVIFVATRRRRLYCTCLRTPLLIACRLQRILALKCIVPVPDGPFPRLKRLLPADSPLAAAPSLAAEAIVLTATFYGYQLPSISQLLISVWAMNLPLSNALASCAAEPAAVASGDAVAAAALRRIFTPILPSVALVSLEHPWSCFHVRFWALITFGLAVPLTATSLAEECSRRRYLQDKGALILATPTLWTIWHAGACLTLFSAILWALGEAAAMLTVVAMRNRY